MKKKYFRMCLLGLFVMALCLLLKPFSTQMLIANENNENHYGGVAVLLDRYTPYGVGHLAIVMGNNKTGVYYFSKSKNSSNSINGKHYDTIEDFKNSETRYTYARGLKISQRQFTKMMSVAREIINGYYHATANSCVDFVRFVLLAGGIVTWSEHTVLPIEAFEKLIGWTDLW